MQFSPCQSIQQTGELELLRFKGETGELELVQLDVKRIDPTV